MADTTRASSGRRRVGSDTSATRLTILDAVERLMLHKGYAAVTYRGLAAEAGVTPALVQYYFPTLDDILLTAIRRRADAQVEELGAALRERPAEPLHVIWEFAQERTRAILMIEFAALAHHREAVRAELARAQERIRQVQLDAVRSLPETVISALAGTSPQAVVFLLTEVPKILSMEAQLGVASMRTEVTTTFTRHLDMVEPPPAGPDGP